MARRVQLSVSEARRIALASQGFDRARPARANDVRHFRRVLQNIAVLQLDFVNVVMPAHFFMLWSRLGGYDRERFETWLYGSGEYIEQWAHEASVVSTDDWPLLAHRRAAYRQHKNSPLHSLPDHAAYLKMALDRVRESGAVTSNDFPSERVPTKNPGDWQRSLPRWALEHHFGRGTLAVRRRLKNFQRVYDLPERVHDAQVMATRVTRKDANRELVRKAAHSLGVATTHDIADYYRMPSRDVVPRLEELLEEGDLATVQVEGWPTPAYLASDARLPTAIGGASLLSPFDPLVWFRPRAARLFDFEYRIEIYVPANKRRWGYYVLPFREGEHITARVDLKADRHAARLLVQNAHLEFGRDATATATALARELGLLSAWMGLDGVRVTKRNAFSRQLAGAL